MVRTAIVAFALAAATTASSQESQPKFDPGPEMTAKISALAEFSYIAGTCSGRLSPSENADIHKVVTGGKVRLHPEDEWFRPHLVSMLEETYIRGVASPDASAISAVSCKKLLNEDINKINAWGG